MNAVRSMTDTIIIHCSATPPLLDIGRDEIDRWHRQRGWSRIGYHYVIRRDGTVELGRPNNAIGAHCRERSMNRRSIGICLAGGVGENNVPENNFTDMQFESLLHTVRALLLVYPTVEQVIGHRDVEGVRKACPSFSVADWLEEVCDSENPPLTGEMVDRLRSTIKRGPVT